MASDVARAPPILDRFKALMRERGEEITAEEIVRVYELLLSELTMNSKPIITDLTIIAGDQRDCAEGIADAICARIVEAPAEQKLPSLYLLDSIVKNIGQDYVKAFSYRLPEVFAEAYRQINPNLYPSMRHLFGTWSTVFPRSVLARIEVLVQFSPSRPTSLRASESPRQTHGIHVNPKYLEERRQFEDTTANNLLARGISSAPKNYRSKFASGYDERDVDNVDPMISRVPYKQMSSSQVGRTSIPFGADKLLPSLISRVEKPSSSFRTRHLRPESPQGDNFLAENKVGRFERPRALIDAYGNDQRSKTMENNMPLKADTNGIGKKTWQNTEEEEFDWEDMSATLANRSRTNGQQPGYEAKNAAPFDTHVKRMDPYSLTPSSMIKDSSEFSEDVVPTSNYAVVSKSKMTGSSDETTQFPGSHRPPEVRNFPHYFFQSSDHPLNPEGNTRKFQMLPSSGGEQKHFINNISNPNTQASVPSAIAPSTGLASIDPRSGPQATGSWSLSSMLPPLPPPSQNLSHLDPKDANYSISNQGLNNSSLIEHQFNKSSNFTTSPSSPNQQIDLFPPYQNSREQVNSSQPQPLIPQNQRPNLGPPAMVSMPPMLPPLPQGYLPQGHNPFFSYVNPPVNPMYMQGQNRPPFHFGPRPFPPQVMPPPPVAPNSQSGSAFSGLINSLMAQGLISATNPTQSKESVGLEFNPDILKVRHESAITALYSDLPRQCKTCGLRFKSQEEHSSHMDWHVNRNRTSKNRKQKPSRKWFVSISMWLTGAEALGTELVPGFSPVEDAVEKKEDEEFSVPADEDQNTCALCGEPFDDFYNDETDEWMYKGAVYMNGPSGSTGCVDRSLLGPIVHAKCRSDSTVARRDEGGLTEEGSPLKRMRT